MDFKRAHSEEQRAERRRQILDTAAVMLAEMPVAKISLNELSRRIGLAKSNVLRYYESREAILLELLNTELEQWVTELEQTLEPVEGTVRERGDRLAAVIAETLARRPVLCDLNSAQASVLDHNVSADVALAYKRASRKSIEAQARIILRYVPELGAQDATRVVAMTTLIAGAAWPYSQPPEAMLAAYAADPSLAAMRTDFTDLLRQALAVTISGLLARQEDLPVGSAPIDIALQAQ
ncbi:TetR/AcrR family transcriptional regulator [Actinoplanes couchii]|uniref:TetR family transcriptional regulator n=1 Tax=Actinoplanes couchii TaxID=403638 RepID=A0ABQ3XJE6_9ACTN|nr:TetR family transcriptional regulator [Actinoplanes couchii]MDR6324384.1 AcrR family transcriptional regulator [Actinoplanes couchii]GID58616.1 TetR family transcriptional regulator [Actinoplanes couchii]